MRPTWNPQRRQELVNGVMAHFAIPVSVNIPDAEQPEGWQVVYGGNLDAAVERIHQMQDNIVAIYKEKGVAAITKYDALFMYASQWLEWILVRGPQDPDYKEMIDLMEAWLVVYATCQAKHLN